MKSRAPNRAARAAELAAINQRDVAAAQRLVDIKQAASAPAMGAASSFLNKAADQYPVPFNYAGNAQDISAAPWSNLGTPTVTGGQSDPLGGANAFLMTDDDPANLERRVLSMQFNVVGKKRAQIYHKASGAAPSGSFTMIRRTSDAFVWGAAETAWDEAGVPTSTWAGTGPGHGPGRVIEQFIGSGWWLMSLYMDSDVDTQNLLWHLAATMNSAPLVGSVLYFQPKIWDA